MKLALILAGALLAGPLRAAPSAWLQDQTRNMHRVAGPFVSDDYGFSIDPPPEAAEYVTDGGDANHGPILILGEGRMITVYPAYTGFVPEDVNPCRRNQFSREPLSTRAEAGGRLDGRSAWTVTFTQGGVVRRVMQAAASDRGTGVMYTLLLETTRRWSRADLLSFRRVADSFRRTPITP